MGCPAALLETVGAALADGDRALELRPNDTDALYLRAVSLKQLGRAEEAIDTLNVLLNRVPDFPEARYC